MFIFQNNCIEPSFMKLFPRICIFAFCIDQKQYRQVLSDPISPRYVFQRSGVLGWCCCCCSSRWYWCCWCWSSISPAASHSPLAVVTPAASSTTESCGYDTSTTTTQPQPRTYTMHRFWMGIFGNSLQL